MFSTGTTRRSLLRRAGAGAIGLVVGAGLLPSWQPGTARAQTRSPNEVVFWNNLAVQIFRDGRPDPTIAARALAILHTCIYDAWTAYDAIAMPTIAASANLKRPVAERTMENKERAIAFAAFNALFDLFPYAAPSLLQALDQRGYSALDALTDKSKLDSSPSGIGNAAALAVLAFRELDGANQMGDQWGEGQYADNVTFYTPVNSPDLVVDPNRWQPLHLQLVPTQPPVVQKFATPHWGQVTPFAMTSGTQFRPAVMPPMYPDPAYTAQAQELLTLSAQLDDTTKSIAEYWSDGPGSATVPGHWTLLAHQVSWRDDHDLDADVRMHFALSNAMFDASIAAWDCKLTADYVRPITAIRYAFGGTRVGAWGGPGQGTHTIDGQDWMPYQVPSVVTPPFPEYTSGHSTFSAAGAEVLKQFTGSDQFGFTATITAGSSRIEPGITPTQDIMLSWPTFSDAADQAGLSRRHGGIHFQTSDLQGRELGRKVGALSWQKALSYFGTPASA
ncbi:MAG: phosphoesterase [Chloroflexota bacterium]|nr:phosphoesterase [Chloroflexota bacterium]